MKKKLKKIINNVACWISYHKVKIVPDIVKELTGALYICQNCGKFFDSIDSIFENKEMKFNNNKIICQKDGCNKMIVCKVEYYDVIFQRMGNGGSFTKTKRYKKLCEKHLKEFIDEIESDEDKELFEIL